MTSAATRLAAVIGHPVGHSLSPAIHTAGFASIGADWQYVAFDVAAGAADAALVAMRTLGIGGLSVTMPHKEQVAECVERLDVAAEALHSVNTVSVAADGALVGHSTDGAGLVAALAASGSEPAGDYDVCVVGGGAAARSIVDALGRRTAGDVVVVNRSAARAGECAALAVRGRVGAAADISAAAVVVNATSVGMGSTELPFDPALLHAGQVVIDIVYHPLRTALLDAADARGCVTVDGLGMLVHQAALQQQHWLGRLPDVRAMRVAAEAELVARGH